MQYENRISCNQLLQEELAAIYIGNLNTVDEDLSLPLQGHRGASFTWSTGESRFITAEGKVRRPLYGMGNRKVTLTVTAEYQGVKATRSFETTVLQEAKETVVRSVRPVRLRARCGCPVHLPSVAVVDCADGRLTTLPVRWEQDPAEGAEGIACVKGAVQGTGIPAEAEIFYTEALPETGKAPAKPLTSYLPMGQVRLLPGTPCYEAQERMLVFLLSTDDDQMLYNFRKAAGLPTGDAKPMTGWDAEECKLKGHTTGHYLSGCALAFAVTGDERFRGKINYLVAELGKCQNTFERKEGYRPGFLSAYSEEQFDLLEKFTKYPEIWAPYYTLDKIMSGLYDCCVLAKNAQAGEILSRMGDWVYERLSRLSRPVLDRMWSMYIAGEFGAMYGTMIKLYRLTGKPSHLAAARLFLNEKLFYPMEQNLDTLEDMHANQHIPQIMGAMEDFAATGEASGWQIARNFWRMVTGGHTYSVGGVGETEMFHRAGTTCDYLTEKAAESCASYHLLRLTGQLFSYTGDGRMMDYYENTLFNHILTSASRTGDGGTTYFLPLQPGGAKHYDTDLNSCCHGTGMESRFRYQEHMFARDEEYLYWNLLIDCELSGTAPLRAETTAPGCLRISALADQKLGLAIRIPAWAGERWTLTRGGKLLDEPQLVNGYARLAEPLKAGEEVVLTLPMEPRVVAVADPAMACLACGSYLLAALSEQQEMLPLPALADMIPKGPLHFQAGGLSLIPLCEVDQEAYHVYFRRETAEVRG